ncbi:hypothetical protein CkaCkLH20_09200 [Colletotrichum karsti]|uniref:Uncharacterized protein n=1 Tax=Colletotrichum karsti TaxID=1095194 RepID=A0A9P6HY35_9PEZI|nr:uncharacterized protein CkaCkLH20_09200 [Colletotrichum karsti]KAF9873387.1 hypothetical protein CkaCkLH20_09200 [Colletotrichum karsti]
MPDNINAKILEMSMNAEEALRSANQAFVSADQALQRATPTPPAGLRNRAQRQWRRAYLMNNTKQLTRIDKVAVANMTRIANPPKSPKGFFSGVSGKGGILAPAGLSKQDMEAWRLEHNKRWKNMTRRERTRLQQQQSEELRSTGRKVVLRTTHYYRPRVAEEDGTQAGQIEELGKKETRKRAHSPAGVALKTGDDACDEDIKYDPATQTLHKAKKRCIDGAAAVMAPDPLDMQRHRSPETKVPVDEAVEVPDASEMLDERQYDGVISVNSDADFMKYVVDWDGHPVTYFDFGPLFKLSEYDPNAPSPFTLQFIPTTVPLTNTPSAHVDEILRKGAAFTDNVIQITAGNPELRQPLTDMGLIHLVAACPRLEYLSIHGGTNITDDSLSVVLEHCPFIRHIALCGADYEPNNLSGWPLLELVQGSAATLLDKIAVMNTAMDTETVRKLRESRPGLRVSARG